MKNLYIECNMGAAGDMLMAALSELHPNPDDFIKRLNEVNIPNVSIEKNAVKKCGIIGTHITVRANGIEESEHMHGHHHSHTDFEENEHHHHSHTGFEDIKHIVSQLNISQKVKDDVLAVYKIIAEAEGYVHNCEISDIHFHEVGTMDAVADIVGVCMLIDELGVDKITASPVNVGKGQVRCAHGILPVPAPAAAYILRDIPVFSNNVSGELCTPTGAALLRHFVSSFGNMPVMKIKKIGYGFGTKDFEEANCVRAFLSGNNDKTDKIVELKCNIDDMSGERLGFAVSRIFESGASDVFTVPINMKKNRPAVLLTCICTEDNKKAVVSAVFKYTTTIGIRESILNRYILDRTEDVVKTKYGDVRIKKSSGYGAEKVKPEYDDLEKIAIDNNIDISDIEL